MQECWGRTRHPGKRGASVWGTEWLPEQWGHLAGRWEQRDWRQPVCPEESHLFSQPAPATAARRGGHRSRADLQPLHSDSLNFSGSVSPQGESEASEEQNAINERL